METASGSSSYFFAVVDVAEMTTDVASAADWHTMPKELPLRRQFFFIGLFIPAFFFFRCVVCLFLLLFSVFSPAPSFCGYILHLSHKMHSLPSRSERSYYTPFSEVSIL